MKILNLASEDVIDYKGNNIPFIGTQFPDGQYNITLNDGCKEEEVTIKSRFNSFLDFELIACSVASLRKCGVKKIHLFIPYLLGARSDRQFEDGSNCYLVDVIAPLINGLKFESVMVMDVHSPVSQCINNLFVIDNLALVEFALSKIEVDRADMILVSPDKGATNRVNQLNSKGLSMRVIECSKVRTSDSIITTIPKDQLEFASIGKSYIIIDDICDGGRTFINIAKQLKDLLGSDTKIYLVVTHGIFSSGFNEITKWFEGIYTTNSIDEEYIPKMFDNRMGRIKVLNIF